MPNRVPKKKKRFRTRRVCLHLGPYNGQVALASDHTALYRNELYVWDGGKDPDHFVHAITAMRSLPKEWQTDEAQRIEAFVTNPPNPPKFPEGIPLWRVNAWIQLYRNNLTI